MNLRNVIHCISGVTEAGDGEDGRIKSAIGIGTLLEDGIGDTIRVSLTEDPEFEIPVCRDLVKRYPANRLKGESLIPAIDQLPYSPFEYQRRFLEKYRILEEKMYLWLLRITAIKLF
jgi:4-hydroxy-3-methylbut-2-en-1-yl diphosphate synthase IspG/GcpE